MIASTDNIYIHALYSYIITNC